LECLCVFLTAVGPSFDRQDWIHHVQLRGAFQQVDKLVRGKNDNISSRVRFLMQDLLDLRKSAWQNKKKAVQSDKGPMKLEEVLRQAPEELGERIDVSNIGEMRHQRGSSNVSARPSAPERKSSSDSPKASSGSRPSARQTSEPDAFDAERFHTELRAVFNGMANITSSFDINPAVERLRAFSVPVGQQASELCEMLSSICDMGQEQSPRTSFRLAVQLYLVKEGWKRASLVEGLTRFFGEIYKDLKIDVPTLPKIVRDELAPALKELVEAGLLRPNVCSELLAVA